MPGIVLSTLHSLSPFISIMNLLSFLFLHMKKPRYLTQDDTAGKLIGLILKPRQSYFGGQSLNQTCGVGVRIWGDME